MSERVEENVDIKYIYLEDLLRKLRKERDWTYLDVVEQLSQKGIMTDEKTVKKWETGLEYPNLDVIYKLSEIYRISSTDLVQARNNSLQGRDSIHMRVIKWICYFTGISLRVLNWLMYAMILVGLVYAFWFFMDQVRIFFENLRDWILVVLRTLE